MSPSRATFSRVLVPTDLSDATALAVRHAAAHGASGGAEIHVLRVIGSEPYSNHFLPDDAARELHGRLRSLAEDAIAPMGDAVWERVDIHPAHRFAVAPYDGILDHAREIDAGLIVMGSHGRSGLPYVLLGSVTAQVVRRAHCPVLVLRRDTDGFVSGTGASGLRRVLFPWDRSPTSAQAAGLAAALATRHGAELLPVHVVADPDEEDEERLTKTLRQELGALFLGYDRQRVIVAEGRPARTLVSVARDEKADLIVMASLGRDALEDAILGSVTERVLRHAPCAVCVVPVRAAADGSAHTVVVD